MLRLQVYRRCRLYLPPLLLLLLLPLRLLLLLLLLLRPLRPLGLRLLQPLLRLLMHRGCNHLRLLRLLLLLPGGPNDGSAILEAGGLKAVAGCPGGVAR